MSGWGIVHDGRRYSPTGQLSEALAFTRTGRALVALVGAGVEIRRAVDGRSALRE